MKECRSDYRDYLRFQKSVSQNILDSYTRDVEHFLEYVEQQNPQGPEQVTEPVMEEYVRALNNRQCSVSTVTRSMASICGLYQLLILTGKASDNPAKSIRLKKVQEKPPQILSSEEIELLLAQLDISEPEDYRDKATPELSYAIGVRVSELVDLDMTDINLYTAMLCCGGHGKNERTTSIYPKAIAAVSDYLLHARSIMICADGGQALFTNLNGKCLTWQGFWKIIRGYAEQVKITKEITPHTPRHSLVLHLLENGASPKDTQPMLEYVNISSTQVYVQLMNDRLKGAYNHCHPKVKLGVSQKEPAAGIT